MEGLYEHAVRNSTSLTYKEAIGFATEAEYELLSDMAKDEWHNRMEIVTYPSDQVEDVYASCAQEFAASTDRPIPDEQACRDLAKSYDERGYPLLRVTALGSMSLSSVAHSVASNCKRLHPSSCYCNMNPSKITFFNTSARIKTVNFLDRFPVEN